MDATRTGDILVSVWFVSFTQSYEFWHFHSKSYTLGNTLACDPAKEISDLLIRDKPFKRQTSMLSP